MPGSMAIISKGQNMIMKREQYLHGFLYLVNAQKMQQFNHLLFYYMYNKVIVAINYMYNKVIFT